MLLVDLLVTEDHAACAVRNWIGELLDSSLRYLG